MGQYHQDLRLRTTTMNIVPATSIPSTTGGDHYLLHDTFNDQYLCLIDGGYTWSKSKTIATKFKDPDHIMEIMQALFKVEHVRPDQEDYYILRRRQDGLYYVHGEGLGATFRADPILAKRVATIEEAQQLGLDAKLVDECVILKATPTELPQQN